MVTRVAGAASSRIAGAIRALAWVVPLLGPAHPTILPAQRPTRPAPLYIGVEDGDEPYVFGRIAGVAVGEDGHVYVVDRHAHELRWFGPDGRFRARIGREGRGPGEFRAPVALAVDGESRIHVLDPGNARIAVFRRMGERLVHEGDARLPFRAIDLCIVGRRRFVLTTRESRTIHELDAAGRVIRSFGVPEEPRPEDLRRVGAGAAMLRGMVNDGTITCDGSRSRIVQVHASPHVVRTFSVSGDLLWRTTLAHPQPERVEASRGAPRGMRVAFAGAMSSALDAAVADDGAVLVTVGHSQAGQAGTRFELHRLDHPTGRPVGRSAVGSRVVAVLQGRRYGVLTDPYPRVVIEPERP